MNNNHSIFTTEYMPFIYRQVCRFLTLIAVFLLSINIAKAYVVDIHESASGIGNLTTADSIIASPGSLASSATFSIIEFDDFGDGSHGNFNINNPFPGGANTTFVAHVTGFFDVATDGIYTYGLNHDDGARLIIDGSIWSSFDGLTDNRNTEATGFLSAGSHSVDIVFFENGGGASLEFFTGSAGSRALVPSSVVPEPTVLALLVIGLAVFAYSTRRRLYNICPAI